VLGLQVLLQCDNAQQEEEWYKAIHKAIKDLVSKGVITVPDLIKRHPFSGHLYV
jgi:hypothetical protein